MNKEEILYEQENRIEDLNKPNEFSIKFAHKIYELFYYLNIPKEIPNQLQEDISNETFYEMFHIDKHTKPFNAAITIYKHYKDQTCGITD